MELTLVTGTQGLYVPPSSAKCRFVFLLWAPPSTPPGSIQLAETWVGAGRPAREGWLVFVPGQPQEVGTHEFENELRGKLDSPWGIAWASAPPRQFDLLGAVKIEAGEGCPRVAADAPLELPAPLLSLGFAAGMDVLAQPDPAGLQGLDFRVPGYPGPGISLGLTGSEGGCVRFEGLLESEGAGGPKPLAAVSVDPLHPADAGRTYIEPLGPEYVLSRNAQGQYQLSEAPE